jgi:hypothetical protein|uniref:Uncharacterized protein n=1 Tax=viral metagenome TaxID=1070528 RepID=A0A6C0DRJ4_9ZZZZ
MLRARDVWDEQEERRSNRMAAMNPIIAQIQAQIRRQAVHNSDAPYIIYPVPTYVFGYPLFSLKEALDHLVSEFSKAGYWVWVVEQKNLLISWVKPVKTRDGNKQILATNYRPMAYSQEFMPQNR